MDEGRPPTRRTGVSPDPYAVLSYLVAGVLFWGGLGWLVDAWAGTSVFVAVGLVLGASAGVLGIYLRYGREETT